MRHNAAIQRALQTVLAVLVLLIGSPRVLAFTAGDAATMINSFNTAFHVSANGSSPATSFKNTTAGGEVWFWGRANQMEMIIDIYERTTNSVYLTQFTNLFNGFVGDYGNNWIWNEFNDDIMWAVIACARAYQKTGNTSFRNAARNNFDSCYARAWSSDLGGGLWWKSPLNTSKNACVNGPAAIAAYLLYQIYNDTNYLAKAHEIFLWERANLVNTNTGQVYDSIYYTGSKDMTPITYNQGTYIGAAHFLGYTNEALLAANYTKNNMTSAGGILPQYDEDNDLGGFNGIFLRWMGKFMRERGLEGSFQPFLQQNANAAWNARRLSDNLSWSKWRQATPAGVRYSFGCWGSVLALHVVPPTQTPNAPAVFLTASDAAGTSSFESGLNWSNSIVPSGTNSFVVSGLELRTPADGAHHQFMGSSLTLSNNSRFRLTSSSSGRVITVGTELILDNAAIAVNGGQSTELAGLITLKSGGGLFDPQAVIFTVNSRITGPGMLTLDYLTAGAAGTLVLNGHNTYTGGTLINSGQTLQLAGAGTLGATNGFLMFSNTLGHGFGTLNLNSVNLSIGNLTGTGGRILNNGSATNAVLTIGSGNAGGGVFHGAINDRLTGTGTLSLVKVGTGTITLCGVNTYTGGTTVSGGTLQFGDAVSKTAWLAGDVTNNARLVIANPGSQTIAGDISGSGLLMKTGAGVLSLIGTNTHSGGTFIAAGAVQIGDGAAKPGGITGNVTNNAMLIFSSSVAQHFAGTIRGSGSLVKQGVGRLTLSGTNSYTGSTTVSSGTLALTNYASLPFTASIQLAASGVIDVLERNDQTLSLFPGQTLTGSGIVKGKLAAAGGTVINPGTSIGTLTIQSNIALAGTVLMELNRGSGAVNDKLVAAGVITGGGVLTVTNVGADVQAGDRFELFNQPVEGFVAVALPELPESLSWSNRVALDGSIEVVRPVSQIPTNVVAQPSSDGITLSWPQDHTGWTLQIQTSSLLDGLGTNWFDVPESSVTNRVVFPIDGGQESVFFRLILR